MSSGIPIVRQISWLAVVPQMLILVAIMAICYRLGGGQTAVWGALIWMVYSFGARMLLLRAHNEGMRLVKQHRWAEAIPKFQQSYDFLERNSWIDRFRSIVLMAATSASYREIALNNIAFCYGQLGKGEKCRAQYKLCLERFPQSQVAITALRILDSVAPAVPT